MTQVMKGVRVLEAAQITFVPAAGAVSPIGAGSGSMPMSGAGAGNPFLGNFSTSDSGMIA